MSVMIENKYIIHENIGQGKFGKIFSAKNNNTQEEVVIKIEENNSIILRNEANIYRLLQGIKGISTLRSYGNEGKYNYMIIDKLDRSLGDLKHYTKSNFDLKTVLSLGMQMIRRIECIHNENIIHRDIKPDNFVMGKKGEKKENLLYIIDFGLSKLYRKNNAHIQCESNRTPVGTYDFMSLHVHEGYTPSRRDDLESIGYTLVYLLYGQLPWMKNNNKNTSASQDISRNEREIFEIKQATNLWELENIPGELIVFIQYCRNLSFEEKPNYQYLRMLLANLFKRHDYAIDNVFCWHHDEVSHPK